MEKFKIVFVIAILVIRLVCSSAHGEEQAIYGDNWQFEFTPYFFLADADFKGTMSGLSSDVKIGFDDIIDNLDDLDLFVFTGRLEAWKSDWGLFIDGQYMDVEYDDSFTSPIGGIDINMDIDDHILDFGAAYKLYKVPLQENGNQMLTLAPLGGVRYHRLKQKANLGPVKIGGAEDWVEPFIGVLIKYDLTKNLDAGIRADYGGFGIGSASDHTWNFLVGIDWKFRKNMSLKLGYRIYDIDYSRYSGNKKFGMDGQLRGPTIGLTMGF